MADIMEILVPDIGGADNVDIIEVMIKAGDTVAEEDALITLETEKASMEIPSPFSGVIESVEVKVGDKISEGGLIATIKAAEGTVKPSTTTEKKTETKAEEKAEPSSHKTSAPQHQQDFISYGDEVNASPSVRKVAREFGVDLNQVKGTGRKERIKNDDIQNFVAHNLSSGGGIKIPDAPKVDFAKFGEIDIKPLSKINKLTGANMSRNWVTIPHVTQFADADITEMEALRQELKEEAVKRGVKLTPLVFIMKAVVESLHEFPHFNSSLDEAGENLIYKNYYHIGIAADTPNGLVVPVIRDVDKKDIFELAEELATISKKAREKGLTPAEMAGSSFTISSLGGIGGTAFTPIVKAPDVAILGVSRSSMKPVYQDGEFVPRLMLPLSLSYDHRVIDGADGARFIVDLTNRFAKIITTLI